MLLRWTQTWNALGVQPPARQFEDLLAAYTESHRYYHTVQHLRECFAFYDSLDVEEGKSAEVELAIWFHDVVYDTKANDNEAASARWARSALERAEVHEPSIARVEALILKTVHQPGPLEAPDEQLMADVDLAILGAPSERFVEYERQVRAEYAWVPEAQFRSARRTILEQFMVRPQIFSTEAVRSLREAQARENLRRSIASLTDS